MSTRVNLECLRGDTAEWQVNVTKDGAAVDLTGAKLWMTGLRRPGGLQVFQRTSPGAGITIDPDQVANIGEASIKLAVDSTSALESEVTTLYYDIQVRTAVGDVWTVAYGDLVVTPDATTETL